MYQSLGHKIFYEHIWSLWISFYLFIYLSIFAFPCRRLLWNSSRLQFKIATHLCSNDLSKKWMPVAITRECLHWIIHQRHVYRKGIPTSRLSYVYTSQSLRAIQFPLEPIRAGEQWPLTDLRALRLRQHYLLLKPGAVQNIIFVAQDLRCLVRRNKYLYECIEC